MTPILTFTTDTVDPMVPQCHAAPGQYLGVIIDLRGVRAVVLPGTGSDDDYIGRAFGAPLRDAGARLIAPRPQPTRLIDGYLDDLDDCRARRTDRGRWCVDRRRGGRGLGVAASRAHRRGAGRAAGLDGRTRRCDRRGRRTALRATTARRRAGGDDGTDARVQSGVAGRRAGPVVARPVAGSARRHGSRPRPTWRRLTGNFSGWHCRSVSPRPAMTRFIRSTSDVSGRPRRRARRCAPSPSIQIGADPAALGAACLAALARSSYRRPAAPGSAALAIAGRRSDRRSRQPLPRNCCIAEPEALRRSGRLFFADDFGVRRCDLLSASRSLSGGSLAQLRCHRFRQLHGQRGADRQRGITTPNHRVRQAFRASSVSASTVSSEPFTTQRIIQR